jgi:glycosyltransferase involved in cell wall biosynthesis
MTPPGPTPKKTVAIVQRYLPHYRLAFFRQLVERNGDLSITVYHGGEMDEAGPRLAADAGFPQRRCGTHVFGRRLGFTLVAQPGVLWTLLRHPPDIAVLEGTFGVVTNAVLAWTRRLGGRRTVYWTAGWDDPRTQGWRHRVKTAAVRALLGQADAVITYGNAARAYVERHGVSRARITVAQNAIDVESILAREEAWRAAARALRQRLGWTGSRVVVYVGGVTPLKRVLDLVEACARLQADVPDLALLVVGDGSELPAAKARAEARGLRQVHFAGAVVEGVEAFFAAGDVFVLPGIGGLALNQAMAVGLPVIATVADGTQEDLVEPGGNGFIARVDDPEDLARCIRLVVGDRATALRMGERSRALLRERATLTGMADAFSGALRSLLA